MQKGQPTIKARGKIVTLRPMGNKNISQEPEIKELKRIIAEGELEVGSFLNQVKEKIEREAVKEGRLENCLKWTKRGRIPG